MYSKSKRQAVIFVFSFYYGLNELFGVSWMVPTSQ